MKTKSNPTSEQAKPFEVANEVSQAHIRLLAAILEISEDEIAARLCHQRMEVPAKRRPIPLGA